MSETTNTTETSQEERMPTQAELVAYRKNMIAYYKEQTPVLKAQLEYERTVADIEEARVKAMTMVIRQAQLKAGPPQEREAPLSPEQEELREKAEKGVEVGRTERKLKTE